MRQTLIAALTIAALSSGVGMVPTQAFASAGVSGSSLGHAAAAKLAWVRAERQRLALWAEIQALRAFERLP
jgi:hypothetical protein